MDHLVLDECPLLFHWGCRFWEHSFQRFYSSQLISSLGLWYTYFLLCNIVTISHLFMFRFYIFFVSKEGFRLKQFRWGTGRRLGCIWCCGLGIFIANLTEGLLCYSPEQHADMLSSLQGFRRQVFSLGYSEECWSYLLKNLNLSKTT